MEPQITARHMELTPKIKQHVLDATGRLNKFFENVVSTECILSQEKFRYSAEMRLTVYREVISASATSEDLFAAIDECADKVRVQLMKYKGRLKGKDPTEITELAARQARPQTDADSVDV